MKEIHELNDEVPGEPITLKTKLLQKGSELLEIFHPINNICENIVGFHFYSGDFNRQVIGFHYCSILNEEFRQCLIYDSDKPNAKLIGVEYIISERLFLTLSEEEKKLWHSIAYEVTSGMLMLPGVPERVERESMKKLLKTYGKTYQLWQFDRGDNLPLGIPNIMWTFTDHGQLDPKLIAKRDEYLGVDTNTTQKKRMDMESPIILSGADSWKSGVTPIIIRNELNFEIKSAKRF